MKKYIALVMALIFAFSLVGCSGNELNGHDTSPNPADTTNPITEKPNDSNLQDDLIKEVESIVDNSKEFAYATVEERFYEDYSHIYIFGSPISEDVIVKYTDGSTQNVKEALEDGHIAITDLDIHGIDYFAEPKLIENIVDLTESEDYETADVPEDFYRDENYVYYFVSIKSHYVTVNYKDGTEQNVKEALAENKIKITDLDWFGISYYKEPIDKSIE